MHSLEKPVVPTNGYFERISWALEALLNHIQCRVIACFLILYEPELKPLKEISSSTFHFCFCRNSRFRETLLMHPISTKKFWHEFLKSNLTEIWDLNRWHRRQQMTVGQGYFTHLCHTLFFWKFRLRVTFDVIIWDLESCKSLLNCLDFIVHIFSFASLHASIQHSSRCRTLEHSIRKTEPLSAYFSKLKADRVLALKPSTRKN